RTESSLGSLLGKTGGRREVIQAERMDRPHSTSRTRGDQGKGRPVHMIRLFERRLDSREPKMPACREDRVPREPVAVRRSAAGKIGTKQRGLVPIAMQRMREPFVARLARAGEVSGQLRTLPDSRRVKIRGPQVDTIAAGGQQRDQLDRIDQVIQNAA